MSAVRLPAFISLRRAVAVSARKRLDIAPLEVGALRKCGRRREAGHEKRNKAERGGRRQEASPEASEIEARGANGHALLYPSLRNISRMVRLGNPSTGIPLPRWKVFTASSVAGPMMPSASPTRRPLATSSFCSSTR